MPILDVVRGMASGKTRRSQASIVRHQRRRRTGLSARRLLAAGLSPVLAAGTATVPVAVVAGLAAGAGAAAVASAPAAKAAATGSVLVLLQNGESSAPETPLLQAAGYTVTQVTPSTWAGMSTSAFEAYNALLIGDPSTSSACSSLSPANESLGSNWQPAVTGNVAVIGAAPAMPGSTGANTLITDAEKYAAAAYTGASGNTGTGLYVSLNCQYSTASSGTAVSWLAGVEGIGTAGGLTVNGSLACANAGTVNALEADASGPFAGFANSNLGNGSGAFPAPACPVEEAFDSWPSNFTPLAFDGSSSVTNYTAPTGQAGQPYVLLGTEPLAEQAGSTNQQAKQTASATLALASASGGEVPAGATTGGTNPADSAVNQATAADPVNTANGDFTQDSTDLSIPTYGPALTFDRSYDSLAAQAEEKTGTPGPLGYGWTDNWATTATAASPVADDIYSLTGEAGATGASDLAQYAANGQPATSAPVSYPAGVLVVSGNVYFSDTQGNRVQEIPAATGSQWGMNMTAGDVYTIAGAVNGQQGNSGDGGPATSSLLADPKGLSMDAAGNLYIADWGNYRVREIAKTTGTQYGQSMTADDIYTVAGGTDGSSGDGGPATSAQLGEVFSVGVDSSGNMYIADTSNNRVQEVPFASGSQWGQSMTAGDMYTIAGSASGTAGESPSGTAADASELSYPSGVFTTSAGLYIADTSNCRVVELASAAGTQWGITMAANDLYIVAGRNNASCTGGATGKAATASDLDYPAGVIYSGGNLFITSSQAEAVQEVAGATGTQFGQAMTVNDVYTVAGNGTAGDTGNGGLGTSAEVNNPQSVSQYNGNLYIADSNNNQIREVNGTTGNTSVIAGSGQTLASIGNGGPAVNGYLDSPAGEVADSHGDLYIADSQDNRIQEIAAYTHYQWGITTELQAGDTYTIAGSALGQAGDSGSSGAATAALLSDPYGLAFDPAGNLLISDAGNNQIRVVAAATGTSYGVSVTIGDIYTIAGSTAGTAGNSGDSGPAASALLSFPNGITTDAKGDIFIADKHNQRIQEIQASGGESFGQTMTAGDMYTIAGPQTSGATGSPVNGAAATASLLNAPQGVATDAAGNLYIADTTDQAIHEVPDTNGTWWGQVMKADDIYTIAGTPGTAGSGGDGGPAASSQLHTPVSIATDTAGDLYIADGANDRVQEIPAASGTQWGTQMTAGDIYTIAGQTGNPGTGNIGDGGPATAGYIEFPTSVALDTAGNLYIGDWHSGHLREVTSSTIPAIAAAPGLTSALYPAPGGITITQPGGSQVTFYSQTGGTCPAPYTAGGSYCVLPQFTGATLTANGTTSWTYTPTPGSGTYTYSQATGQLTAQADTAGDALTITYQSPNPGQQVGSDVNQVCPSTAHSCQTITSASGRALVLGLNSSGLVTTATDPLGRTWTYGYTGSDLTTVTDPTGKDITTYTYDTGNAGPLLTADMLTITAPNAQPGGPDAGDDTVNTYNPAGQVTAQTDPMGWKTTFSYSGINPATGSGTVAVTDPDGNVTVNDYQQGTLADQTTWTGSVGSTLTSQQVTVPDTSVTATTGTTAATDGSLQPVTSYDGDGNQTTYTYDAVGDVTSSTSPSGGTTSSGMQTTTSGFTSISQGDQQNCTGTATASSTDTCNDGSSGPAAVAPGGTITPASTAPPLGVTWTLNDTDGNQLYTTAGVYSPTGTYEYAQTTYQLFKGNSITLNSTNITCTWTPPSASLPCASINADGVVTQLQYSSQGDLIASATPDGNSGGQLASNTSTYDADGEQLTTVAPDGNVGGANAGNYTTTTVFNADGQKTSVTQGNGSGYTDTPRTTSYGYDADGNQTTVTSARGYATATTYNADDEQAIVKDADSDATLTCYDGDGNVAETVPPVGVAANSLTAASCPTSYPADYNPATKAPLASDATLYGYDASGNKTAMYTPQPAGATGSNPWEKTTYAYDSNGNLLTTTAPATSNSAGAPSQVTTETYNNSGDLASETTGYGTSAASTVSYCYDPNGDKTSVVYADGNTSADAPCGTNSNLPYEVDPTAYPTQAAYQTTYAYDSAGELVSTTTPKTSAAPNGAMTTLTYDAAGNVVARTDPDGVTTTLTYTPLSSVATVAYSGSAAHSVTYSYDASGNKTGMTDATGSSSYQYDPFDELTSAENGASLTTTYGHNADGQVIGITYPLGSGATWATSDTVTYGYDDADQLTAVTDFNGHQISIGNTADGLKDSASLGSSGDTVTTTLDPTDNPSAITLKNSSSTLQSLTYSDSPAGTILSETDTPSSSGSPAVYAYDAKGRVTAMTPGTGSTKNYSFDASGNLMTLPTGATVPANGYNDAEELLQSTLSSATTSYTYNADGEQTGSTQGSSTNSTATWNGAGQLATYGNAAAEMTAATYDGDGLRASTTITPTSKSAVAQGYVWNTVPQVPQLLLDGANAYIYDGGVAPAEQVSLATGAITYLVTDLLGSVRGTVNSAGSLTSTTSYDAWGNPLTTGGLTATTPFGYAGGYTDPTGLIYLFQRFYDPAIGQFLSVDPDLSQTNYPYAYAGGNPVSEIDPTGQENVDPPGGTGYSYPKSSEDHVWRFWADRYGDVIPLRQGNSRWGWDHAVKHYITPDAIGEAIQMGYRDKFSKSDVAFNYAIVVRNRNLYEYEGITQETTVVVGVRLGEKFRDGFSQGVITGFCTSGTSCPSWVWNANWEYVRPTVYRKSSAGE